MVFTNIKDFKIKHDNSIKITDHETLIIESNKNCVTKNKKKAVANWSEYNKSSLTSTVLESMVNYAESSDINDEAENICRILTESVNKIVKMENIVMKLKKEKWFDRNLFVLKEQRDRAYCGFKNGVESWSCYQSARNDYFYELRRTKMELKQKEIESARNDGTKLWKTLKSWINPKNSECNRRKGLQGYP